MFICEQMVTTFSQAEVGAGRPAHQRSQVQVRSMNSTGQYSDIVGDLRGVLGHLVSTHVRSLVTSHSSRVFAVYLPSAGSAAAVGVPGNQEEPEVVLFLGYSHAGEQ